jgi:hypothetical protein
MSDEPRKRSRNSVVLGGLLLLAYLMSEHPATSLAWRISRKFSTKVPLDVVTHFYSPIDWVRRHSH